MEKKISKGDLVRVNEAVCFTAENGGEREWPLTTGHGEKPVGAI